MKEALIAIIFLSALIVGGSWIMVLIGYLFGIPIEEWKPQESQKELPEKVSCAVSGKQLICNNGVKLKSFSMFHCEGGFHYEQ